MDEGGDVSQYALKNTARTVCNTTAANGDATDHREGLDKDTKSRRATTRNPSEVPGPKQTPASRRKDKHGIAKGNGNESNNREDRGPAKRQGRQNLEIQELRQVATVGLMRGWVQHRKDKKRARPRTFNQ